LNTRLILIIGILALAVTTSVLIRAQPMQYGMELHEFDPFFNYRATQYLLDNGYESYINWHDDMSWYPEGRTISWSAQIMLHVTAAVTYDYFGQYFVQSLYEYVIYFPLIIGGISVIVVFGLVRSLAGYLPGLFSAFFFAIAVPITLRGVAGWFKSEPLGILFGLVALWLIILAVKHRHKYGIISSVLGGVMLTLGMSAWGGAQFFVLITVLFLTAIPFIENRRHHIIISGLIFASVFITSLGFERLPIFSLINIGLLGAFGFNVIAYIAKSNKVKALVLAGLIVATPFILSYGNDVITLPSHRYLNAINPTLSSDNIMVDSVAEHGGLNLGTFFALHSLLFGLALVGGYFIIRKTKLPMETKVFTFIITGISVYMGIAFVRLGVYTSLGLVIMAGIGVAMMLTQMKRPLQIRFLPVFVILILFTMFAPGIEWVNAGNFPPLILTGATAYNTVQTDWLDTMDWIKTNTPEDSVIVSWWDYGYWIQTLGERASTSDNSTLLTTKIEETARALMSTPSEGREKLIAMEGDYFLTVVSYAKVNDYFVLQGGGDESKSYWISELADSEGMMERNNKPTGKFFSETFLAYTFPFDHVGFVSPEGEIVNVQENPNYYPVFEKSDREGLVYASPSWYEDKEYAYTVFVYELRSDE
jgi:dolichyl-diphosphooligosaccharide--protein glycosyltransferase